MPESYRPVLISAGLKHPRVREFLAVKHHPASRGQPATASRGQPGPARRDQHTMVAIEGTWMLRQALLAGVRLTAVFVCPALLRGAEGLALAGKAVDLGAEGYEVSEKVLARLTDRDGPDGVVALGLSRQRTLGDIPVSRRTRVVIADDWDLPGNLGTLIRCADGAGAAGVLVVEQGFGLSHPLVLKASMGAALGLPVVAVGRPVARRWLRDQGFRVVAADPAGRGSYRDADYRGPLAIVVGSERRGLAQEWLSTADSVVAIPMLGSSDSLNAAVAGALLLYEALAQDR
jgi:RNA methyltransferase, TrmH family